ncbi:MAG: hypothetical protein OXF01_13800 [Gemmatimonadetes bacterium]|nr:hypothetical protein [Gemmatimonadota bacterium]
MLGAPLLAVAVGCGGGPRPDAGPAPGSGPAAAPGDIVTGFLDAANSRDHAAMAMLFGTGRGPIGEPGSAFGCGLRRAGSWVGLGEPCVSAQEIELRMDVIARILAHRSRRVGAPERVAGRGRPAARVEVEMTIRNGDTVRVPFVLIQAEHHGWLVERVELGRLTG